MGRGDHAQGFPGDGHLQHITVVRRAQFTDSVRDTRHVREGFLAGEALADGKGHQLPHLQYPGLTREDMLSGVNRFFDEYYFRPRIIWRIVREALWDADERKRLTAEAVDFLKLRFERNRMARKGLQHKAVVTVPAASLDRSAPPAAD